MKIGHIVLVLIALVGCIVFGWWHWQANRTSISSTVESPPALCTDLANTDSIRNLPPPPLRNGIGHSHLTITTRNSEAQKWFDQGINLLHDFWHVEAYRAFKAAIRADSTCAMGYWGIAMCQPGFGGDDNREWLEAIRQAMARRETVSPLEQDLIEATDILVHRGFGQAKASFQQLINHYPNEPEAIAFSAIILRQAITGQASSDSLKHLLEKVLVRFPNHTGLLHYYMHVMETRTDFAKALPVAEVMLKTAPLAPHIRHMPGHLYFLSGNYTRTAAIFEDARQLELDYHRREAIPYGADQNYMHNLNYLTFAYSELGQKAKALEIAQHYAAVSLSKTAPNNGSVLMLMYEGRILPALVYIRFQEFAEADKQLGHWLTSLDVPLTNTLVRTYLQAMQAYCRGMLAIQTGNSQEAINQGGQLTIYMKTFEQQGMQRQGSSEFRFINETYDILSLARYELAGWIDNIDPTTPFNTMAWQAALDLEKDIPYDEPPRLMYPISESLGRLRLRRAAVQHGAAAEQERVAARQAFGQALRKRPHSALIQKLIASNQGRLID